MFIVTDNYTLCAAMRQKKCISTGNIEAQYYASKNNTKVGFLSIRQAFECERQGSCEYGGVPHYVFK